MLLCVRRRNQQRATRVCLRLASPEGNSTAQDWHNVAERIAHVNEEGTWVNWTKRPKDTGIREWYVHGKQEEMLRTLLERAGQMLKRSGVNNELSILLLTEPKPLKRWCEYVSGGGDLRIDGDGYDHDERGNKIEHVGGRLLNAVKTSERACSEIEVKLT
jgi:hypothetical protein